jgi:hypothetical protein
VWGELSLEWSASPWSPLAGGHRCTGRRKEVLLLGLCESLLYFQPPLLESSRGYKLL